MSTKRPEVLSARFDSADADRIRRAAKLRGLTVSEYIRRQALSNVDDLFVRIDIPDTIAPAWSMTGTSRVA